MTTTHAAHVSERDAAIHRLQAKRVFRVSLLAYLSATSLLVILWMITRDPGTFFWPAWLILPWGIGLIIQGWILSGPVRGPFTEDDIKREVRHRT